MQKYNGFSLRENKVIMHYGRMERKQDIEFFNSTDEAREFYNEVSSGDRPKRSIIKAIKQMFCQHDTNKLSGYNGENTFYSYCGNCGKAHYEDNRTEEEFIAQAEKNKKAFARYDIRELRERQLRLEHQLFDAKLLLEHAEKEYENKYGEKA